MSTIYIYVDGESHFIRSEAYWKALHGTDAKLEEIEADSTTMSPNSFLPQPRFHFYERAKFFWDAEVLHLLGIYGIQNYVNRAVYFTSCSGDPDSLHSARAFIRRVGFEPHVIQEPSDLSRRRANRLSDAALIEKAKGVDIALSVRMVEDAYLGNYQKCVLFTSDADFLPAVEAVRRMGRDVFVVGYKEALGSRPLLEFVPDRFVDLGETIVKVCYRPRR